MPREEDLPPSKRGQLENEITSETLKFHEEVGQNQLFVHKTDKQKIDYLITYFIKNQSIMKLQIEYLLEKVSQR
jgi:hypothetical protein